MGVPAHHGPLRQGFDDGEAASTLVLGPRVVSHGGVAGTGAVVVDRDEQDLGAEGERQHHVPAAVPDRVRGQFTGDQDGGVEGVATDRPAAEHGGGETP
ncbi:hypothetical protein GCM10010094_47350 [Streptomyces flaveus]|uniref:Uncharacterized protein n=1 Tax=Streptomyces flaveus TaxID=66370 RepID=A0A917QZQ1_9ACTN|nr:hypothetical protein [Streptomyces flaveus]GGK80572.1 hypothetical protein GCM10010094_47350 [Streptomyces flaveus]